jgi:hypothetical protein
MKRFFIIPTLAIALIGGTLVAIPAWAQTSTSKRVSLVQKIAQRFGLKEADVQSVFDQDRTEHQAEMQKKKRNN